MKRIYLTSLLLGTLCFADNFDDFEGNFDPDFDDDVPMKIHKLEKDDYKKMDKMWKICARCHGLYAEKRAFGISKVLANKSPQQLRNYLEPYLRDRVTGCMAKVLKNKKKVKISPIQADKIAIYISEFKDVPEPPIKYQVPACMIKR